MATLARPDGVELHWEERGAGPLVVFAAYWSLRRGPYDIETSAADLEAMVSSDAVVRRITAPALARA